MISYALRRRFRSLVRERVAALMRTEIACDTSSLMQDIWDQCANDDEELAMEAEIRSVIETLTGDRIRTIRRLVETEREFIK